MQEDLCMHNFKKAVLATLALFLAVVAVFSLYTMPYFHGTSYYYQDAAVRDSLAGTLDFLAIGSSHGFRAFDTEVLDRELGCSSYNLACAMQTMRGRYYLLRKEMQRNPVDTVILEVSYNALTRNRKNEGPEGDIYALGRFSNPLERLHFFFSTIYPSEYPKLFFDTIDRAGNAWDKFKHNSIKPYSGKGFQGLDKSTDMGVTAEELDSLYHSSSISTTKDADDALYFEKCIELCREKGVRLILVVTPISDWRIITHEGFDTVLGWLWEYQEQYGCELYDFNLIKTRAEDYPMDTSFFDGSHLTTAGAKQFTEQLCQILKMAQAGEDTAPLFLPDYAAATEQIVNRIKTQ